MLDLDFVHIAGGCRISVSIHSAIPNKIPKLGPCSRTLTLPSILLSLAQDYRHCEPLKLQPTSPNDTITINSTTYTDYNTTSLHHNMSPSLTDEESLAISHANGSNGTAPPHQPPQPRRKRIIVAMTGATGTILGIKLLIALRRLNVETHLVISKWAEQTLKYETDYHPSNVRALADHVYNINDMAAAISSGSFRVDGMIVVPCSMKTLASITTGLCDDLISRAADVMLKERRKLVLVARETPLSEIHLRNMLDVTRAGAIIFPPVPAYYIRPASVDDLVNQSVGRMLDMFDLDTEEFERWNGWKKDN